MSARAAEANWKNGGRGTVAIALEIGVSDKRKAAGP